MKTKVLLCLQTATIIFAGIWVFWPALHGTWVWDDAFEIVRNPLLRDRASIWKTWVAPIGPDYFPLKTTVQWLEWRLWEKHCLGYHLTNLALHLMSGLLFWRLLVKLRRYSPTGSGPSAFCSSPSAGQGTRPENGVEWLGGLLLVVHPLAVESVAWIAELKNTLSLPFLLGAMIAYLDFDRMRLVPLVQGAPPAGQRSLYLRALLYFLLAVLAKSSVVMFPLVILLYVWWQRGKIARQDLINAVPFFAIALGLGLVTVWFQQHRAINGADLAIGSLGSRLAAIGFSVLFYLGKFFIPLGLAPLYPRWSVAPLSLAQFLPWLALGGLVGWLWTKRSTWGRGALFGSGFFAINLLPVLGLIPMAFLQISWVADHFVYLPMLGLIGLVVAGGGMLADWLGRRQRGLLTPLMVFALILLSILAFSSRRYAAIFRNNVAFWSYALRQNPQAWLAQNNLGAELANYPDRLPEALAHAHEAIRLKPDLPEGYLNLGLALARTGRAPEAIAQYRVALSLRTAYPEALDDLGIALSATGQIQEAIQRYEEALRLEPDFPEVRDNLAMLLEASGRVPESLAQFEEGIRLDPDDVETRLHFGNALADNGRLTEAAAQFEATLRLQPDFLPGRLNLANVLAKMPEHERQALAQYAEVLRLDPANAAAHFCLANTLAALPGRSSDAQHEYAAALRLRPGYAEAHANLGALFAAQPDGLGEAVAHYEEALRLDPKLAKTHYGFAVVLDRMPGREADAFREYAEALRLNPNYAEAHNNLAIFLARRGQWDRARDHWETALKLKPDFEDARRNLRLLEQRQAQPRSGGR